MVARVVKRKIDGAPQVSNSVLKIYVNAPPMIKIDLNVVHKRALPRGQNYHDHMIQRAWHNIPVSHCTERPKNIIQKLVNLQGAFANQNGNQVIEVEGHWGSKARW